jgi:uncharacterized protein (TIGR00299 family) protein
MLLGAFIDAGAEVDVIQRVLDLIPQHFRGCREVKLSPREAVKHGFRACRAELTIVEDRHETSAEELRQAVVKVADSANFGDGAKSFATDAVRLLTEVESKLHGVEVSRTHLHEAGSADTLADILGTAAACESLKVFDGKVYSCLVAVGGGTVTFSHGTVSVPAPAVLEIVRRHHIPILRGPANEELATPTGVAILANLVDEYVEGPPPLVPEKVGYGAGLKELANAPNVMRVVVGESVAPGFDRDSIMLIETNLDDVSGEIVGNSLQLIIEAGAKDVWVTPAQFKKNRPGYTLHAICDHGDLEKVAETIFRETGSLGVRYREWERLVLSREIDVIKLSIDGESFEAKVKVARDRAGRIVRIKPEFEDAKLIAQATSRSLREISDWVLEEARKRFGKVTERT